MSRPFKYLGVTPTLFSIAARLSHPALSWYESKQQKPPEVLPLHLHPVFIAAAPRTGSTILYQALTNSLDVLYPDNVVNHFYRDFNAAFRLSNFIYGNKAHNCFTSHHGRTYHCGMHAPGDVSGFWYRWFRFGQDYLTEGDISNVAKEELRTNIFAVSWHFRKPIIFKNQHNSQRLRLLRSIFPEMKIVFLHRNPIDTLLSILTARQKEHVPEQEWWSVKPKNYSELQHLPLLKRVMSQVYYLEKEIHEACQLLPPGQVISLQYEAFCQAPKKTIEKVRQHFFKSSIVNRNAAKSARIVTTTNRVDVDIRAELHSLSLDFDWVNYSRP